MRVSREERKSPAYLAINPAGAVPAFEEDGWVLTQNAAILNYLADSFPDAGLGGDGTPRSRAEVNRWLAFANADVHPAFHPLFGATAYLDDPALIELSKQAARKKLRGLFERADAQLAGQRLDRRRPLDRRSLPVRRRSAGRMADGRRPVGAGQPASASSSAMLADPGVQRALRQEGLA